MAFYSGQKVVFVGDGTFKRAKETSPHLNHPVRGCIYTIRELTNYSNVPGLRLVEITNEPQQFKEGLEEPAFLQEEFRPLNSKETSIAAFESLLSELNDRHKLH